MTELGRHPGEAVARSAAGEDPAVSPIFPLSWPVPLALGLVAGILLGFGLWWGLLAALVPAAWAARFRAWPLVALCLLGLSLGALRERQWWSAPDPTAAWTGQQVTVTGDWDGQFLRLKDPPVRLALRPKPTLPPGGLSLRGRLVRPEGRRIPGGFDDAFWLRVQGVRAVLVGAQVRRHSEAGGLRSWFRRGLTANLDDRRAALLTAIELGDKGDLAAQTFDDGANIQQAFARAGLAHLMALSGQNVAILVTALTFLLARTRLKLWRYPVLMLALLGYLWLVGPSPSVVRAVIMAELALLGLWVGRGRLDLFGVLGLAATGSLLWHPGWLFDVGFQLSFLAVAGLSLSGRLAGLLPARWPMWLRYGLSATVLAEAATLPVSAGSFHQVSLVNLPANLLAEPLMAALVPLGFLSGLLGPLAGPLNALTGLLGGLLLNLAAFAGRLPVLPWGSVGAAGLCAYAVFALAGVLWLTGRLPARGLFLVTLLCVLGTALPARLFPPREVVYLDVGQGDSTLLRLDGLSVLVDGGGTPHSDYDVGAGTVVPALRAMGVNHLDVVVATHADSDHIEGLSSVLRLLPVGELWIGQRKRGDPVLDDVLAAAKERGVPVREVRRGDTVRAGRDSLTVLWPEGAPWSEADNENSVAVRLDAPGFRTAVLGDLPDPIEGELGLGALNVLKTAHHGSRFSSDDAFLNQVRPHDAVISVGRNTYGHPNPDLLARLAARGVRVWRTDLSGTIRWPLP